MIARFASLLLLAYAIGFVLFAFTLGHPASAAAQPTDAAVVLTGAKGRIEHAIDVLEDGKAGRLLIAGADPSVTKADLGSGTPALANTPSLVVRGNISSYSSGALWSGASPGYGVYLGTKATSVPASLDLRKVTSLPVDFDSERVYLGVVSEHWRDAPSTGQVTRGAGVVQLTGTQAAVEVFVLAAADVASAQTLKVTNVRPDAHLVINLAADTLRRLSFTIDTAALQPWRGRALFNAHDAETVKFNDLTLWGTLLAPNACVCNSTGKLEGSVVARKWSATMQITYTPFVPTP